MAKSNYLFGILSAAAVFICGYTGRDYLVAWEGESLKLKDESRKGEAEFSKQTTQSSTPITQGPMQKGYQEGVLLGAKSAFLTTDNRQPVTGLRFRQLSLKKIYDSQIGVRERGINAGSQVEEYLHYVNLGRGQPWCAAFVCWVFGQAGIENPRTAWSPDLFPLAKIIWSKAYAYPTRQITGNRQPDSYRVTTPGTGDIFGLFFPEKNRIAHAGFIDQWDGTWLITVEGNTNMEGSREGDGVYRKRRLVRSIYQVARYTALQ